MAIIARRCRRRRRRWSSRPGRGRAERRARRATRRAGRQGRATGHVGKRLSAQRARPCQTGEGTANPRHAVRSETAAMAIDAATVRKVASLARIRERGGAAGASGGRALRHPGLDRAARRGRHRRRRADDLGRGRSPCRCARTWSPRAAMPAARARQRAQARAAASSSCPRWSNERPLDRRLTLKAALDGLRGQGASRPRSSPRPTSPPSRRRGR